MRVVIQIGADGLETGLLNILFGEKNDGGFKNSGKKYGSAEHNYADSDFTDEQVLIAQALMKDAGFTNDGKENPRDVTWIKNKDSGNTIKANLIAESAGNTVATQVFMNIFDEITDEIVLGNETMPTLIGKEYRDRFYEYTEAKWNFYTTSTIEIEKFNNLTSTDSYKFGPDTDNAGESDDFHKAFDKNIKNQPLSMQFSGKIVDIDSSGLPIGDWKNTSGKNVNYEIGFMFENLFISTGIQHNLFHLDSTSDAIKNYNYYDAGTSIGVSGNTGLSTGPHIHTELQAHKNFSKGTYYSNNFQKSFLNFIGAPSLDNYTNDATKWKNNQNFYSKTYSSIYININNLWR